MDSNHSPEPSQRGTFLGVLLTLLGGVGFVAFTLVILSPFLAHVIGGVVVVMLMVGFGFLHYWLWGRSMSQQVAGEREEEEMKSQADADPWPPVEDIQPRRRF